MINAFIIIYHYLQFRICNYLFNSALYADILNFINIRCFKKYKICLYCLCKIFKLIKTTPVWIVYKFVLKIILQPVSQGKFIFVQTFISVADFVAKGSVSKRVYAPANVLSILGMRRTCTHSDRIIIGQLHFPSLSSIRNFCRNYIFLISIKSDRATHIFFYDTIFQTK